MTLTLESLAARRTGVVVRPFTDDMAPAVGDFNARLAAGDVSYQFPAEPGWRNRAPVVGQQVSRESYVAVDEEGHVRGGYIIRYQTFQFRNGTAVVGFYQLPLSEGLIDRQYGSLGVRLLADALKRQPDLFVLGVGAESEPLARMVRSLGWPIDPVPFYFKVVNGYRFARGMRHLRRRRSMRYGLDAAAFSGVAWAGAIAADRALRSTLPAGTSAALVDRFPADLDEVWESSRGHYAMVGARDVATLAALYPEDDPRFLRIVVRQAGRPIGWAVLLDTQMADHRYFGDLRVGTIADCLAAPDAAPAVMLHSTAALIARGVDLIVSNQRAGCWRDALRGAGFFEGPSTFLFGPSKRLAGRLQPLAATLPGIHLNRGDGDGPINL